MEGVDPNSGFSFVQVIQPILDRNCTECHTGETSDHPFSLLDKVATRGRASRAFSESYLNLTRNGRSNPIVNWLDVQSAPPMLPPNYAGATKSQLITMFEDGNRSEAHKDVTITDLERRQLALWIDLLVPFVGCYTERHAWTPAQQAEHAYYQMKRDTMAAIEQENIQLLMQWQQDRRLPSLESFTQFNRGGVDYKRDFIASWLQENRPTTPQRGTPQRGSR